MRRQTFKLAWNEERKQKDIRREGRKEKEKENPYVVFVIHSFLYPWSPRLHRENITTRLERFWSLIRGLALTNWTVFTDFATQF